MSFLKHKETQGTSNLQIEKEASIMGLQFCKEFKGCASKDQLKNKIRNNQCYVINIGNSVDSEGFSQPGTHWVACGKKNNSSWYFDSFGLPPPIEIRKFLTGSIYCESTQYQANKSDDCGIFALCACVLFCYCDDPDMKDCFSELKSMFDPDYKDLYKNDQSALSYLKSIETLNK